MHKSVVLDKLRRDAPVWCAASGLRDPSVIELLGYLGAHCVWICTEHRPLDLESVRAQVRAAKMLGMDTMIRVSKSGYTDYIHPYEMDATGIMVPHVMSAEEARNLVETVRFPPQGRRPLDGGYGDGPYAMRPAMDYAAFAHRERFLVVQIEDREAVDNLEAIVAVDGIDVFFIGPADLSHSYGVPGEMDHPLIEEAIAKLATLCARYGRHWGMPCPPEKAPALLAQGARFLAYGGDITLLRTAFTGLREQYRALGFTFTSDF